MKKISWLMLAVIVVPLILTACGAEEKIVEVTRVVTEKETVVQKETVVETVVQTVVEKETVVQTVVEKETVVVVATPETAEGGDADVTIFGEQLPSDAAPYAMQIYKVSCDITGNHTTFDFQVAVYQRFCLSDLFQDTLVDLDSDFNVIPAAAESWEVSADGLTWTFHIAPGLQWSDGTPLTAYDWEATYQMIASPEHAWDFAWFYAGVLQNWDEIIAGELPPSELGVKAVDDLTLEITTQNPWPALPGMMKFGFVNQKKALEEHGPLYNSSVETSVSAGPFMLELLEPGDRIELVANPMYKGYRKPFLQRLLAEYRDRSTDFLAFQTHEIDQADYEWLTPADFAIIEQDPDLMANYLRHYGDFRTDYLLFDTFNPPFNDINVRKAFAHAVDRESIVENIMGEIKGIPAYSMLMPGYPASDTEGNLTEYQQFDCAMAQEYLAEAGYPGGEGFPGLELWLRNEGAAMQAVYQGVAASITDCLGVPVEVSNKDFKAYMDALNAKPTQLTFGAVSYGMDFLDPSNLLGIWVSTGRHSWKNDAFDELVAEASIITDDFVRRGALFQQAEEILVDDVGGIFIDHRWQGNLFQPYLQGAFRTPDSQGISGWHWGNDYTWGTMYISKDVENYDTYRGK